MTTKWLVKIVENGWESHAYRAYDTLKALRQTIAMHNPGGVWVSKYQYAIPGKPDVHIIKHVGPWRRAYGWTCAACLNGYHGAKSERFYNTCECCRAMKTLDGWI